MPIKVFLKMYKGLPKSIYVLFLARMINTLGNFVYPFLTIFLTDKLNMSHSITGIFVTSAALATVPGALVGGKLADHVGRKKVMVAAQGLAALCFVPCAFLGKSMMVPYLLILSGMFNGAVVPANTAMVTDLTNEKNRKTAFSFLYLGSNIGFAVGPLVAGYLYNHYIYLLFLGNAVAIFISMILILKFVKETMPCKRMIKEEHRFKKSNEKAEEGNLFQVLLRRPELLIFTLISAAYSFVHAQCGFTTPIQVKSIFGIEGPKLYGTLMTVNGVVIVFMTTIIIGITKKISPVLNIAVGGIFFAAGFGMLSFAEHYMLFIISTIIWSCGEVLFTTNSGVYIASHTPITHRARFNSIVPFISSAGYALAPIIMGWYLKYKDIRSAWVLVFIISLTAAGLMYLLYLDEKKKIKEGKL